MSKNDGLRTIALLNAASPRRLIGYVQVNAEEHVTGPRTVNDGSGAVYQVALRSNRPDLPTDGSFFYDDHSGSFMPFSRYAELEQMRKLTGEKVKK